MTIEDVRLEAVKNGFILRWSGHQKSETQGELHNGRYFNEEMVFTDDQGDEAITKMKELKGMLNK